jgi:hypothetical protein
MKFILVAGLLATSVVALPQPAPTATVPKATVAKVAGPLLSEKDPFQLPDFGKLASQLGIDPAKATPDANG